MRTIRSREIFKKKCRQQQIFDSDLKGAWHYNHVTFTPIAKKFMLYCRLIYMLSILCVRPTIKVKVGIPESFNVGWYPAPPKKPGRATLNGVEIGTTSCRNNWYTAGIGTGSNPACSLYLLTTATTTTVYFCQFGVSVYVC